MYIYLSTLGVRVNMWRKCLITIFLYISLLIILQHALKNLISTTLLSKVYWPNHNITNKLLCTLIFPWLQGHTGLCEWASFLLCYDSTAYLFMPHNFCHNSFQGLSCKSIRARISLEKHSFIPHKMKSRACILCI